MPLPLACTPGIGPADGGVKFDRGGMPPGGAVGPDSVDVPTGGGRGPLGVPESSGARGPRGLGGEPPDRPNGDLSSGGSNGDVSSGGSNGPTMSPLRAVAPGACAGSRVHRPYLPESVMCVSSSLLLVVIPCIHAKSGAVAFIRVQGNAMTVRHNDAASVAAGNARARQGNLGAERAGGRPNTLPANPSRVRGAPEPQPPSGPACGFREPRRRRPSRLLAKPPTLGNETPTDQSVSPRKE